MSKSYIQVVSEVKPIEKADKLEAVKILGFWCVVGKGLYNVGDKAVYIETDSVISEQLESVVFANSKIKPHNRRIRAIKIRGFFSEGLVLNPIDFDLCHLNVGADCDSLLGVTKYEPPETGASVQNAPKRNKSRGEYITEIPRYVDTTRLEKVPDIFKDDDMVHITAKIHGTSARFGWSEIQSRSWFWDLWLKAKRFFGFETRVFVSGSRNVDFPQKRLYADCAEKYDLKNLLPPGVVLYGEIAGHGIQGNGYNYGCSDGEFVFLAYAMKRDGKYVDYNDFLQFCYEREIPIVPNIAIGKWCDLKGLIEKFAQERVDIEQNIPCREGVVIGLTNEDGSRGLGERTIVKYINPEYLLNKNNTDEH